MTNPYNVQLPYQNADAQVYQQQVNPQANQIFYPQNYGYVNQPSLLGGAAKAAAVGFTGGALVMTGVDYFKTRKPVKNGETTETFAKKVLDRIIEKDYVARGKKFFKQKIDILKNIDCAKTPEAFKKLMKKNKEFCSTLCDGISIDTMCSTVTKDNIKGKISALKKRVEASFDNEIQNIKDTVKLCWDSENKKFVKPDGVDKKLFKIIENTKNDINWSKVFKVGGIAAGVTGLLALGLGWFARKSNQG